MIDALFAMMLDIWTRAAPLVATGLLLPALACRPAPDVAGAASLALSPCPPADNIEDGLCGTLEVFEDRAAAAGRRIVLRIVVLPALSGDPHRLRDVDRPAPVLRLAARVRHGGRRVMIAVRGLRKRFGDVVAVDDVTFEAHDGRVTGLLGPNGAGKTTTLRVLYGLVEADAGEVRVDDVDVRLAPRTAQRRMGVLPESRGLYVRLTAREHLRYYGRLQGMSLEDLGVRLDVGPAQVAAIVAGTVPLAFLSSGVQLLVSTFARSFKEAQTYVSLLIFVPMVPGMLASVGSLPSDPWMAAVPALAQQMLLTQVLGGETPGFGLFLLAGASSLLLGLLCVATTARLFRHERIVFGTAG